MTEGHRTPLAGSLLLLLYPLAVFVGLRYADPRWLALLLIVVAGWRLFQFRGARVGLGPAPLLVAAVGATAFTLITGSSYGLLFYPVLVNAVLLILFIASLARPPSAIERLARLRDPELPPEAARYTRRVTQVWTAFFAINGGLALTTVFLDPYWWALYNGFIAYLMMGTLMGAEWLVRRRVRGAAHG